MKSMQHRLLSTISSGTKVRLAGINAGHGLNQRLAAMGLVPETELEVIKNGHPGPFIISVRGTRIALGRGIAHKILVK